MRKATWLELFFDLVFVATAHQFAAVLVKDMSYLWLFIPVLWVWVGHVMFMNRFPKENKVIYLLTIVQMIGVIGLAVFIQDAFVAPYFGLAYAIARIALVTMYCYEFFANGIARESFLYLVCAFSFSILLWLVGAFTQQYYLWVVATCIDIFSPLILRNSIKKLPVHPEHFPERLGLLTIILFGEVILSSVITFDSSTLLFSSLVTVGAMLAVSIMAYTYFSFQESCLHGFVGGSGHYFLYSHLGLFFSLLMFAVAIKGVLKGYDAGLLLLVASILYLITYKLIRVFRSQKRTFNTLLVTLVFLLFNYILLEGLWVIIFHFMIMIVYLLHSKNNFLSWEKIRKSF